MYTISKSGSYAFVANVITDDRYTCSLTINFEFTAMIEGVVSDCPPIRSKFVIAFAVQEQLHHL